MQAITQEAVSGLRKKNRSGSSQLAAWAVTHLSHRGQPDFNAIALSGHILTHLLNSQLYAGLMSLLSPLLVYRALDQKGTTLCSPTPSICCSVGQGPDLFS